MSNNYFKGIVSLCLHDRVVYHGRLDIFTCLDCGAYSNTARFTVRGEEKLEWSTPTRAAMERLDKGIPPASLVEAQEDVAVYIKRLQDVHVLVEGKLADANKEIERLRARLDAIRALWAQLDMGAFAARSHTVKTITIKWFESMNALLGAEQQ